MKKAYTKVISILILVLLLAFSLAGCEQIGQLQSLLPGAQTEAPAEEESGEGDTAPVSGDISELQGAQTWVYLIEENAEKGESSTGILIYNPALGGYGMSGVTGTEAYIEWDGREFNREAEPSATAEGWYHSAQLATNIRKEDFVLRINLLRGEEEPTEIRLENPKVALLAWPALADKNGIKMEKSGSSYSFSAETISELFHETVPGVFRYRIKDCTDCNVLQNGDALEFKSISSNKASFSVEITDPAGETKQVQVGISRVTNMKALLIPIVIAAVLIAIAGILLWIWKKGNEKKIGEARGAIQPVKEKAETVLGQCRTLYEKAENVQKEALMKEKAGSPISKKVIDNAVKNAKYIVDHDPDYDNLKNYFSDLEKMYMLLKDGKKETISNGWTKRQFLNPKERSEKLKEVSNCTESVAKAFQEANADLDDAEDAVGLGKYPFAFALNIHIIKEDVPWEAVITEGKSGVQKMGNLWFYSRETKNRCKGEMLLSAEAAEIQFYSLNRERMLIFSEKGKVKADHAVQKGKKQYIWLHYGGSVVVPVGDPSESITVESKN